MALADLEQDRKALVAAIHAAFGAVTRAGGVSWSEAFVIDLYGSEEERARARKRDTERSWTDLVDDPEWRESPGVGGFCFLDPIGFRYYLPAAMLRVLRLTLNTIAYPTVNFFLEQASGDRNDDFSLLTREQKGVVAWFTRHMLERSILESEPYLADLYVGTWEDAYKPWAKWDTRAPIPVPPDLRQTDS